MDLPRSEKTERNKVLAAPFLSTVDTNINNSVGDHHRQGNNEINLALEVWSESLKPRYNWRKGIRMSGAISKPKRRKGGEEKRKKGEHMQ